MLDSWRAQAADSMCVCMCLSWKMSLMQTVRGSTLSLFSCARARRVKSRHSSLTHTLCLCAVLHMHTMRLRCLGLGLRPRALGSHTPHQYSLAGPWSHNPSRCSEWLAAPQIIQNLHSQSSSPFLKYEDPWRYVNAVNLCIMT